MDIWWKCEMLNLLLLFLGNSLCWARECERQQWPGSAVAPWVLKSLLWQTGGWQRFELVQKAPDGDCARMLWGVVLILSHSILLHLPKLHDWHHVLMFVLVQGLEDKCVTRQPLIYWHFSQTGEESSYAPVTDWSVLSTVLTDALESYNDLNAAMDLVLFEDAMQHV